MLSSAESLMVLAIVVGTDIGVHGAFVLRSFKELFQALGTAFEISPKVPTACFDHTAKPFDMFGSLCTEVFEQLNKAILFSILPNAESVCGQHVHVPDFPCPLSDIPQVT